MSRYSKNFAKAVFSVVAGASILYGSRSLYLATLQDPYNNGYLFWGTIAAAIIGFLVRQRLRKTYGINEFLVGFTLTISVFKDTFPTLDSLLHNTLRELILKTNWPSLISGVYFIIRSLDNIGKGLKRDKINAERYNKMMEIGRPERIEKEAYRL